MHCQSVEQHQMHVALHMPLVSVFELRREVLLGSLKWNVQGGQKLANLLRRFHSFIHLRTEQ